MERRAEAIDETSDWDGQPPGLSAPPKRTVAVGTAPRVTSGGRWNPFRRSLDYLTLVGMLVIVIVTGGFTAVGIHAFGRLARDGLSVFIPFEHGGKQFTDLELVHIGVAMAVVLGAAIAVLHAAWRHAEEFLLITVGGFGAGILAAILSGTGVMSADVLFRAGMALLGLTVITAGGLCAVSISAPVSPKARVCAGTSAFLAIPCAGLLGWSLSRGLAETTALEIPMEMPRFPPALIAAAACAAVALALYFAVLRTIVAAAGDEPTRRALDRMFIFHGVANSLAVGMLTATNTGAASGWLSGLVGLVAVVLLVIDYTLSAQIVRFARCAV